MPGAYPAVTAVRSVVRELFLAGVGPAKVGQPKVVACVTGGGGPFWSYLLSEPGASSCLLEGVVPYDKHSLLSFLERSGRAAAPACGAPAPRSARAAQAAARTGAQRPICTFGFRCKIYNGCPRAASRAPPLRAAAPAARR